MKRKITIKIWVHEVQAELMQAIESGQIDFDKHTLRDICKIIGIKESPQTVKHHLDQLLKIGAIDKVAGNYYYNLKG